jgi:hypothetical protein
VSVGAGFVVVYRWLTRPAHDRTWPSQSGNLLLRVDVELDLAVADDEVVRDHNVVKERT